MAEGSTAKNERKVVVSLKPIPLQRGDSGYLSPVTSGSTPEHLTPLHDGSATGRSGTVPTTTPNRTETMQHNGVGPAAPDDRINCDVSVDSRLIVVL